MRTPDLASDHTSANVRFPPLSDLQRRRTPPPSMCQQQENPLSAASASTMQIPARYPSYRHPTLATPVGYSKRPVNELNHCIAIAPCITFLSD